MTKVIFERAVPGVVETDGTQRYSLTREHLEQLYKEVEDFVADCPREEYEENKETISSFLSLLHHHINSPLTASKEYYLK